MKQLSDHEFELAESPRWLNDGLYFTDIDRSQFFRWSNEHLEQLPCTEQITSFVGNAGGGLVFGTMHGLYKMQPDGTVSQLAAGLKINDMCADPMGRVIFGTNYHSGEMSYPLGSLYVFDSKTGLRELDYGLHLSNGIGFSPDGKTMYVCDTSVRCIFAYDYDVSAGTCGRKRILIRFRMDDGMPDGMAIDSEGCIWTAQWYGKCVIRTSPEGKILQRIAVPAAQVSAVEFTPEGLFITTAHEYGRLDIAPHAFSPDAPGIGGGIYITDPGVSGQPHAPADL